MAGMAGRGQVALPAPRSIGARISVERTVHPPMHFEGDAKEPTGANVQVRLSTAATGHLTCSLLLHPSAELHWHQAQAQTRATRGGGAAGGCAGGEGCTPSTDSEKGLQHARGRRALPAGSAAPQAPTRGHLALALPALPGPGAATPAWWDTARLAEHHLPGEPRFKPPPLPFPAGPDPGGAAGPAQGAAGPHGAAAPGRTGRHDARTRKVRPRLLARAAAACCGGGLLE